MKTQPSSDGMPRAHKFFLLSLGVDMKTFSLMVLCALLSTQQALGEPLCQRFSMQGEVKGKESFFRPIGMGLSFRMEPSTESGGWIFEIGPTSPREGEWSSYIYILTPPFRGRHLTMLDTSYGTLAQEAAGKEPRDFEFLLNRSDAPKAKAALDQILWPNNDTAQDDGLAVLGSLPKGEGVLRVLDADIVPGTAVPGADPVHAFYGMIKRMTFNVQLVVPQKFVLAGGLRGAPAACPDTKARLQ